MWTVTRARPVLTGVTGLGVKKGSLVSPEPEVCQRPRGTRAGRDRGAEQGPPDSEGPQARAVWTVHQGPLVTEDSLVTWDELVFPGLPGTRALRADRGPGASLGSGAVMGPRGPRDSWGNLADEAAMDEMADLASLVLKV